jgi:hypothetical protein
MVALSGSPNAGDLEPDVDGQNFDVADFDRAGVGAGVDESGRCPGE